MLEMVEVDSATGWKCCCAILMKYWVYLTPANGSLIDRQQTKSWCGVHHLGHAKQRMVSKQLKHVLNQMTNIKHRTYIYIYILYIYIYTVYIYIYTDLCISVDPHNRPKQKVETIESRRKACWTEKAKSLDFEMPEFLVDFVGVWLVLRSTCGCYRPRFPACELKKQLWLDVHQWRILYLSHWCYSTQLGTWINKKSSNRESSSQK